MKEITPKRVLLAMIKCRGRVSDAAQELRTTKRNVYRILDENPDIQEQLAACHNDLLEEALDSAHELVQNRDREMTKFVLDRLGSSVGFDKPVKKIQISGDKDNPLVTKIDFSKLSDEELENLIDLTEKASN